MKRHWKLIAIIGVFIVYLAFGIYGWLGTETVNKSNQDGSYWSAIYSHSNAFVPFLKTHDVLVPSARDLNVHTVFNTYGFMQKVDVSWIDPQTLQVICERCNQTQLAMSKVDNISITLVKK